MQNTKRNEKKTKVVFLGKTHLLSKSTGYTQKAVAPSRHELKNVYRDVKQ